MLGYLVTRRDPARPFARGHAAWRARSGDARVVRGQHLVRLRQARRPDADEHGRGSIHPGRAGDTAALSAVPSVRIGPEAITPAPQPSAASWVVDSASLGAALGS
jgi:hypothetical protein